MKKIKKLFNLFLILTLSLTCTGQSNDFTYKETEVDSHKNFEKLPIGNYKSILEYLPKNYVKDGTIDYTGYIQKAIDENKNIVLPNFPILINDGGLKLKSNFNLFFQKESALIMKPSTKTKYSFFSLTEVDNVNIYNPTLLGDRKTHLSNKGEWGMGISIYGSTNVKIYNVNIKDTWGDGIYINSNKNKHSYNVLIKNGYIDNARRNGISIISG